MENELSLSEIHKETLIILKKIISICESININYYLAYGSLIGAVRHHGFIPWDDDLDLVMLRPDYEQFCSYCTLHKKELYPFMLLNRENIKGYPYNISRFSDMRYKAVYHNIQQYDSGMFVDIYPLDGAGDMSDHEIMKMNYRRDYLMRMILWSTDEFYEPSKHNKWYRSIIKRLARSYAKMKGADYFLDKMEGLGSIYPIETSKYVAEMVWDPKTILLDKKWFNDYSYVEFEGLKVKAPLNVDSFLRAYYGDYMTLPKIEDRHPSHDYKIYYRH